MLNRFFFVFFISIFFFLFSSSNADDLKINYVDIDRIISQSNAGKKMNSSIDALIKKKNKEFLKIEENLKKKDGEIIKQQNILSKDELNKKIKDLQQEIQNYRTEKDDFRKKMAQKKLNATGQMVSSLNKILGEYANKNSISLIIQKKNIVIGKSDLDITKQILDIFNKEVKEIKLN